MAVRPAETHLPVPSDYHQDSYHSREVVRPTWKTLPPLPPSSKYKAFNARPRILGPSGSYGRRYSLDFETLRMWVISTLSKVSWSIASFKVRSRVIRPSWSVGMRRL